MNDRPMAERFCPRLRPWLTLHIICWALFADSLSSVKMVVWTAYSLGSGLRSGNVAVREDRRQLGMWRKVDEHPILLLPGTPRKIIGNPKTKRRMCLQILKYHITSHYLTALQLSSVYPEPHVYRATQATNSQTFRTKSLALNLNYKWE